MINFKETQAFRHKITQANNLTNAHNVENCFECEELPIVIGILIAAVIIIIGVSVYFCKRNQQVDNKSYRVQPLLEAIE